MRPGPRPQVIGFGFGIVLALLASPCPADPAGVPIEVYGRLPALEEVALSPSGSRIAYVTTSGDTRTLAVKSLADGKLLGGLKVGEIKLRSVDWADDDHLLLTTSWTGMPLGLVGTPREWFLLQVYDLRTRAIRNFPDPTHFRDERIMNVVIGRSMVRHLDGHAVLFLHGMYLTDRGLPMLLRLDLDSGVQRIVATGHLMAQAWLVDESGEIAAEQAFDERDKRWSVSTRIDGRLKEVATGREAIDYPRLLGFGPEPGTLLMRTFEPDRTVWRLMSMKDGGLGPLVPEHSGMHTPLYDPRSQRMMGGVRGDDEPHYVFFDPKLQARWDGITATFGGERVRLVSFVDDLQKVVVRVEGQRSGFSYYMVDLTTHQASRVGDVYIGVTAPLEVRRIDYAAADGMRIPAYLTLPRGRPAHLLPLVVLPHGGPDQRDSAEFDWWSQALGEQGYAVLRPNYRGSALTWKHQSAGFGEWGRKMQTDLSDGIGQLAKDGIVDPTRVCIVGGGSGGYGGYAAFAGVTLQSGVYRCAVSVAGIGDLQRMLRFINEKHRYKTSQEERYWDRYTGLSGPDDPALAAISPIRHLDALSVPLLLIHGKDDTVVPYAQSETLYEAAQRLHKAVELVTLKREDHWLSRGETRLQMLQASVAFLRAHNPPD